MLIQRPGSGDIVLYVCKREIQNKSLENMINTKGDKNMKTTTSIKIVAVTIVLLVAGCILSMLTIKNYNPFNGGFLTAVCANVCILCCLIDEKRREDAEAKNASANIDIR